MKYKRDAVAVKKELVKNQAGQTICKSGCRIHTPVRFVDRGLSVTDVRTYVFGQHALTLENGTYAVMNVCARMEISPSSVTMIEIDGADYYEFCFDPGTVVYKTDLVVQDDKIIYFVIDEMIFQAKVPWYIEYDDLGNLFSSARHYADSKAADVLEVIELLVAIIARNSNDETQYIRHAKEKLKKMLPEDIQFIPLSSVHLTVTGTVNRIAGNYFEPAIEGALVTPSKKIDNVERILRA